MHKAEEWIHMSTEKPAVIASLMHRGNCSPLTSMWVTCQPQAIYPFQDTGCSRKHVPLSVHQCRQCSWFLRCRGLCQSAPGWHLLKFLWASLVQMEWGSFSEPGPWVHWFSWRYNRVWTGPTILAHETEEMYSSRLLGVQEERLELQRKSLSPQRCLFPSWAYRANIVQPNEFLAVLCHATSPASGWSNMALWSEHCETTGAQ